MYVSALNRLGQDKPPAIPADYGQIFPEKWIDLKIGDRMVKQKPGEKPEEVREVAEFETVRKWVMSKRIWPPAAPGTIVPRLAMSFEGKPEYWWRIYRKGEKGEAVAEVEKKIVGTDPWMYVTIGVGGLAVVGGVVYFLTRQRK